MTLTRRQQQILDWIMEFNGLNSRFPSTREIAGHFGFASQTAALGHMRALERKGFLHHSGRHWNLPKMRACPKCGFSLL